MAVIGRMCYISCGICNHYVSNGRFVIDSNIYLQEIIKVWHATQKHWLNTIFSKSKTMTNLIPGEPPTLENTDIEFIDKHIYLGRKTKINRDHQTSELLRRDNTNESEKKSARPVSASGSDMQRKNADTYSGIIGSEIASNIT